MKKLKETTSGSVASVAPPIGKPLSRSGSLLSGKKTSQKFPNSIKEDDILDDPTTKKSNGLHNSDAVDTVKITVPLLIRLMEYSKESAADDEELHLIAENLTKLSLNNKTLTMSDYDKVIDTKVKSKHHIEEGFTPRGYHYTSALVLVSDSKALIDRHINTLHSPIVETTTSKLPNGKNKVTLYLNESLVEAGLSSFNKGDIVEHGTIGQCKVLKTDGRNVYVIADNDGRTYKVTPSSLSAAVMAESDDPCWTGYEQIGMKKKRGKEVPNCVPKKKKG